MAGYDTESDLQVPTSAVDIIRNGLEHEYPHSEIIQKIKNKAVGPQGNFCSRTATCLFTYAVFRTSLFIHGF